MSKAFNQARNPQTYDEKIGAQVKMARLAVNMSQTRLAEMVGITFQQIQKYEKGTNRIGGSRLVQIAQALKVDVRFFFETISPSMLGHAFSSAEIDRDLVRILKDFARIKHPQARRAVADLVTLLADTSAYGTP